tara:strand:- start:138318 stop:139823 length:1506 start_codon:yes stop_codon:yes gene_type:complete
MSSTLWPKVSSAFVDRSLTAHSLMGLVISAILYIVCVSGTVAVLEDEFGWWERADTPAVTEVTPAAVQNAIDHVVATQPESEHVLLYLPRENWPRFVIGGDDGLETANANGEAVAGYDTAWNEFLIHLHYYLSIPEDLPGLPENFGLGMIIVAIFGVMMVGMSISGLLAHPRIFRDAFRLKREGQQRLVQADIHNRLSVWTLPFNIIVAGTGALIGLFVVIALVMSLASYGTPTGLTDAVFGSEGEIDRTPAPLADGPAALATLATLEPDARPFLLVIEDPGTVSQMVEVIAEIPDRLVYSETYMFSADGELTEVEGNTDGPAGQQIFNSVYRLHFGDFGGTAMKIAYIVLGTLLCIMVATGLNIYFLKRAEKGRPQPKLASAWSALVWGTPFLMAFTLFMSVVGLGEMAMVAVFWLGSLAIPLIGFVLADAAKTGVWTRRATGAIMVLTGVVHSVMNASALSNHTMLVLNASLIITGICLLMGPFWTKEKAAPVRPQHAE